MFEILQNIKKCQSSSFQNEWKPSNGVTEKFNCLLFSLETIFSCIFFGKCFSKEDKNLNELILVSFFLFFELFFWLLKSLHCKLILKYFFVLKYFIFVLLTYLLLENINNFQTFYLGVYLIYLHYLYSDYFPNIFIQMILFQFMVLCFSFQSLESFDNIFILVINLLICFLIEPLNLINKCNKKLKSNELNNFNLSLFTHIADKIYPGAFLILQRKEENCLNESYDLIFSNFIAQNNYKIYSYHDLLNFFKDIKGIQRASKCSEPNECNNIFKARKTNLLIELFTNSTDLDFSLNKKHEFRFKSSFLEKEEIYFQVRVDFFMMEKNKFICINFDKNSNFEEKQKLQEISKKKDNILFSVSHDLRSPLNGIINFVTHAKGIEDINERNKYLDYSRINADLLLSMINDLLDFAAIEKGNINLNIFEFSLNNLVQEVYELMKIQAEVKKINIKVYNEFSKSDIQMRSDLRRIKQILINLLNNSIKFTLNGVVTLFIGKTKRNNLIKIEIIDSGIGIKQEIIDSLGHEYATFDTENGLNKYGIGLGLSICKKLLKLLGPSEDLFISSIYGKGTKIGFLLYCQIQEENTISLKSILTYSPRKKEKLHGKKKSQNNSNSKEIYLQLIQKPGNISYHDSSKKNSCHTEIEANKIENDDKRVSLSDYNNKIEKGRSILRRESYNKNYEFLSMRTKTFNNYSPELKSADIESFSPFSSFLKEIEESHDFEEGNTKINILRTSKNELLQKTQLPSIPILLVDDNPFNLLVLKNFFQKLNFCECILDSAINGNEAISLFISKNGIKSENPYKFIFMDCIMPIKDGYIASQEIKSLIKENKGEYYDVIIIAVTGMSGIEEEKKCLEHGMDDFLTKPIQDKEVADILKFYINKLEI